MVERNRVEPTGEDVSRWLRRAIIETWKEQMPFHKAGWDPLGDGTMQCLTCGTIVPASVESAIQHFAKQADTGMSVCQTVEQEKRIAALLEQRAKEGRQQTGDAQNQG